MSAGPGPAGTVVAMDGALYRMAFLVLSSGSVSAPVQEAVAHLASTAAGQWPLWPRLAALEGLAGPAREAVAAQRHPDVRAAYLARADLDPVERAALVAGEGRGEVLAAAARCPHTAPELLSDLAGRRKWPVAEALVANPACPADAFVTSVALLDEGWERLREKLAVSTAAASANPATHDRIVADLVHLELAEALGLLGSPSLSPSSEDRLVTGLVGQGLAELIAYPGAPSPEAVMVRAIGLRIKALGTRPGARPAARARLGAALDALWAVAPRPTHSLLRGVATAAQLHTGRPEDLVAATTGDAAELAELVARARRDDDTVLAEAAATNPALAPAQLVGLARLIGHDTIAALRQARPEAPGPALCALVSGAVQPGALAADTAQLERVVGAIMELKVDEADLVPHRAALQAIAASEPPWSVARLLPPELVLAVATNGQDQVRRSSEVFESLLAELGGATAFEVFAALVATTESQSLSDVAEVARGAVSRPCAAP